MRGARWEVAEPDLTLCAEIERQLRLHTLIARCLVNRGCVDSIAAGHYLEPRLARLSDPFALPDMNKAVERLFAAHAAGEQLVIFGDYDVDGVTSTAILTEFFQHFGWRSFYYLPHRMEEGYGLSPDAVQNCLRRFPVKLLLAVDCGSSAVDVIREVGEAGVDVIVLDHHQVADPRPPALALVNPRNELCSAGLAFKLAHALTKRARELGWTRAFEFDLRKLLDLVALGTIADLVPLQGENRIFAHCGLERLARSDRTGVKALKCVSAVGSAVTSQEVAFQLAPRLNAAGRLETALDALELLLTDSAARAESLAGMLDGQNRERQALEQRICEEVIRAVRARFDPSTDFAIVEADPSWHIGVVGIVASRVLREFYRPVFVLGGDGTNQLRGSGRSIEGVDLAASLRKCGDLLLKHGGHAMAAGVTLASEHLVDFRARLNECIRAGITEGTLQPKLRIDAEVKLGELTFQTLKGLERIEPVGQGNPPVHLASRGLQLRSELRRFGSAEQHVRFVVSDGTASHQVVWWNSAQDLSALEGTFDLAFAPELSEYNGTFGIQLRLLDLRPSSSS